MNFTELALYKCYLLIIIIIIIILLLLSLLLFLLLLVCLGGCLSLSINRSITSSMVCTLIDDRNDINMFKTRAQATGFTAEYSSPPISAREIAQLL